MAQINFNTRDWEIILKALANRRRLEILGFLKKKREATVGEVADYISLSFKSTSRHLGLLHRAEIIGRDQRGPEVYYIWLAKQNERIQKVLDVIL